MPHVKAHKEKTQKTKVSIRRRKKRRGTGTVKVTRIKRS